jgi:methionyl-tRNA formyltransferase
MAKIDSKLVLESLPYGSYGMHGSSEPLPKGRGRSPLNWSLIEDKRRFLTHLIRHDPGVDTGNIIAVQEFDINEYDTAETLHYKNQISAKRLLLDNLPKILSENYKGDPQFGDPGAKYPKRTAEDGLINWNNNTKDIYNLVRAVTDPFPGAFSYLENKKVMIWQAQPFDTKIIYQDSSPGEIVDIFYSGDFVVKTKSDSLLIMDYEGINEKDIKKGLTLRDLAKSE